MISVIPLVLPVIIMLKRKVDNLLPKLWKRDKQRFKNFVIVPAMPNMNVSNT